MSIDREGSEPGPANPTTGGRARAHSEEETLPAGPTAERVGGRDPSSPGLGQIIGGRFKLVEHLGCGAMGEVFVAENISIGVKVAVKLLKAEFLADPEFRQRFQREAQAIAHIEHPNVARFHDLVVGNPTFLVMEYVRGPTLAARLREVQRMAPADAVRVALRLCWALRAAHEVGVIHRDLKPSNVVLARDPEQGEVPKLIDFGLAKVVAQSAGQSLTRAGQLVGTPQYMSPEQIAGNRVDARSDIYALGCLLWEMLAGSPPFSGGDDFQILYQQVHEPAPRLIVRLPEAPRTLDVLLQRALEKNPDDRHQSIGELAAALASAVPEAAPWPVVPPPAPPARPSIHPAKLLAGVGLAVIALGFGGGYVVSRVARKPVAPPVGATIFVLSEPSGALVEVDGKALPHTTPTMAADLPPGAHEVHIQRVGAAPVAQTVTVKAGERAAVNVTLPPVTHKLEVRTVPDGASAYLDGRLILGETPTTFEITDDDFHELRVEKTGFETVTRPLTPDDKESSFVLTLQAEKSPRGTLLVDSNTAGEVWVDGVYTGYTTPTLGFEVSVGAHIVEVRDGAGNASQPAKVMVARGQTMRVLLGAPATAASATPKGHPGQ